MIGGSLYGRLKTLVRQVRARPRLSSCAALLLIAGFCLPKSLSYTTRWLVAWDIAAGLYLVLAWTMMLRGDLKKMRVMARHLDDGAATVLTLTVGTPIASLVAILLELVGVKNYSPSAQVFHLGLAAATVVCSWCLVHTAFALHYAHRFYLHQVGDHVPCLQFPGAKEPDYADFLYFSFIIGTSAQTADVTISSSPMRRLALVHCVIAFFFNTTVLALTINIAAGLT